MWDEKYRDCLTYIDQFWNKIILKPQRFVIGKKIIKKVRLQSENIDYHILDVPYTCLVPNTSKYRYVFYWDSYFMFSGILKTKNEWVIVEMVENFLYIFNKYQIIPNFSHPESLGRSQAPFLTSMIFMGYDVMQRDRKVSSRLKRVLKSKKKWLKRSIEVAKKEYFLVWESTVGIDHKHYNHKVPDYELNRYGDRDVGYGHNAEKESGWDFTSRFYDRCDQFLPIDLNCYLYTYEIDFAKASRMLGEEKEAEFWENKARARKENINTYMWNQEKGFFYDYDYINKKQSSFLSLAGFVPLWAGLATEEQAQRMVEKLAAFQTPFGLAITDQESLPPKIEMNALREEYKITIEQILKPKQWDYPNIWPPLHYLVVMGLLRYGFTDVSVPLMSTYVESNAQAYRKYLAMLEKMDGLTGDMPPAYWYPTQLGFGWTNAIFYRYIKLLSSIEKKEEIYAPSQNSGPPFTLLTH